MGKKILVPIDFSDVSGEVVRLADEWAQRTQATLHCLRVISHALRNVEGESSASFAEEFDSYLQGLNLVSPYQVNVQFGIPYEEILDLVKTIDPELIIMAAHSHTVLDRFFLGSNTDYVVHHCHCPVYVHKQHTEAFSNNIIVPLDYTEVNKPMVKLADAWAQRTGAELYFIHTLPVPERSEGSYTMKTGKSAPRVHDLHNDYGLFVGVQNMLDVKRLEGGAERPHREIYDLSIEEALYRKEADELRVAQRTLEEYVAALDVRSTHQMVCQTGKPYRSIENLQKKTRAGLVMMAAHSHTLLNRLFVGSNTDYLLHHLKCPMYVYKE